ncbi:MAG: cytochrome P450 [Sphingomonadales bacterium]|nr:MAG: cytochrome P450 [Sphingomonadales bacterium]
MSMATDAENLKPAERRFCPAHVPTDKIRSLDAYNDPRMRVDPIGTVLDAYSGGPIFWNDIDAGFKRGCWVITGAADQRKILMSPDFQNNNYVNLQGLVGERWKLIPTGIDGDLHKKMRAVMTPWFTPQALAKYNDAIDQRANELIDQFVDRGECEFIADFGFPFPISIFLEVLGLPVSRMPEFVEWEHDMLSQSDFARAAAATEKVLTVLRELIEERRDDPRDDLATAVVQAEFEGRPLTDDEMMGMLFGFFLGGLDTVTTSLGMHFYELASNQSLQDFLRANPEKINVAVEEMLRRYSPVSPRRQAMKDVEIHGVTIKAGDWVQLPTLLGSLDPTEFPDPMTVDLDRKNKRHLAFVTGIHFCLGHVLARRELHSAYATWLKRLPSFRVGDRSELKAHGGMTVGYQTLPIVWDASQL